MIEALLLVLFGVTCVGAFLFTGVEVATLAVNRQSLRDRLRAAGEDADEAFALLSDTQHTLATVMVAVNVCALLGGFAMHTFLRQVVPAGAYPGGPLILTVLLVAPLHLIASDVLARPLVRRHATGFLIMMRAPLAFSVAVTTPVLYACTQVAAVFLRPFGIDKVVAKRPMTADEIVEMIGEPEPHEADEVSEVAMMHGAIDLEESNVREVMRPLVDVIAIKIPEATVATALEQARQTGYSRFPVFRHKIIEMTEYVDITRMLTEGAVDGSLRPYLQRALLVPETMRIDVLLRSLTEAREQCAMVVDEFGGVVGWVTREDVLEEIVGDIADKDADEEPGWRRDDDDIFHVEARMDLDDLNDEIGTQLYKGDEFDTLGGWIYTWAGRIPTVGDVVEEEDARVTVEAMDAHRVVSAAVELIEDEDE